MVKKTMYYTYVILKLAVFSCAKAAVFGAGALWFGAAMYHYTEHTGSEHFYGVLAGEIIMGLLCFAAATVKWEVL